MLIAALKCSRRTTSEVERVGATLTILSFLANLDQARLNLMGHKGSILIPITILVACFAWGFYGMQRNDKPLMISNIVGIAASITSIVTYFW